MKNYNPNAITKLIDKFDQDLKSLLMQDLKDIKDTKNKLVQKIQQSLDGNKLSAA